MTGCQVIFQAMEATKLTLLQFINDFSDEELLVRPVPEANHAAWQIGNVILGDQFLVQTELPDTMFPEFPQGFAERHSSAGAQWEQGFLSKAEYVSLLHQCREVAQNAVLKLTDADLDRPSSERMKWAGATLGHVLLFVPTHTMMHAGQFSVIRRKLGKPVLF